MTLSMKDVADLQFFAEPEIQGLPVKSKPALAIKTTNLRVPVTAKGEKPLLRPKISNPVLQKSEDNDNNSALRLVNGERGHKTTTKDAEILNKKITDLMQQASALETQRTPKKKKKQYATAEFLSKPSPFQRGKDAFSKATRAITGRLNNGRRPLTPNVRRPGPIESSPSSFVALEYLPEPRARSATIERRVAEGENLSSTKIRNIIGDGSIPRKPLPVYESMKSRRRSFDSADNPFSDGNRTEDTISPEVQAELDFDFNKRKGKGKGKPLTREPFSFEGTESEAISKPSTDAPQPLKFSNKLSGLAQHPDVMAFSSSPIGYSTPRIRLESLPKSHGSRKGAVGLKRSPSILEFSFEESEGTSTGPNTSDTPEPVGNPKRKSAKDDLRSKLSPTAAKRLRKSSTGSKDDLTLESEFRQLNTRDTNALVEKDKNTKLDRPSTADSNTKGPKVSDSTRHIKTFASAAGIAKRPRAHTVTAGRTSIPRPNSILFSRESRAHYRLRDTTDGDSMDIDELQMYEGCFTVGGHAK